jgi:phosphate starvation-inducible PhoH-like protein
VTQIDLPSARRSGLIEAVDILQSVNGLAFVHFDESDVVRHHLVQRIIRAYDEHKTHIAEQQMLLLSGGRSADASGGRNTDLKNSAPPDLNSRSREASGE